MPFPRAPRRASTASDAPTASSQDRRRVSLSTGGYAACDSANELKHLPASSLVHVDIGFADRAVDRACNPMTWREIELESVTRDSYIYRLGSPRESEGRALLWQD